MSATVDIQEEQNPNADFINTIGANAAWTTARLTSYNQTLWSEGLTYGRAIGQYYSGSYYVDRGHVYFDTSSIPNEAIILSAYLRFKVKDLTWCYDANTYDFGLVIKQAVLGTYLDHASREEVYDEAASASAIGYFLTSWNNITHSVGTWLQSEFNLKDYVDVTGASKFHVVSTRDTDDPTPPATTGVNSRLSPSFYSGSSTDRAVLRITYVINPENPSSVTATPNGTTEIDLSWVDNGGATSGFKIHRSTDGLNFDLDAYSVDAGETTFAVTGLSVGVPYYFEIQAVNPNGRSSTVSASPYPVYTQYPPETSTVEIVTGGV